MKIIIIVILGLLSCSPLFGEEVDNNYKAFSVSIGEGGSLSLRKSMSHNTDILFSSNFTISRRISKDRDEERYNPSTSQTEKTTVYGENKSGSISASIGLRKYLQRNEYSIFWQAVFGPYYDYSSFNYYDGFNEDKEDNLTRSHTLGLMTGASAGVEYKFSESMSLEITYSMFLSAHVYHLGGDEELDWIFLGDSTSASFNYYW